MPSVAFAVGVVAMTLIIFGLWWSPDLGWVVDWRPSPDGRGRRWGFAPVAWPLYPIIGASITVAVGMLLSLRHKRAVGSNA